VFKQLPFMIFSDLIFPGNGIGGTGDYNTFVDASENSDAIPPMAVTIGMREVLSVRRIRLYSETGAWKQTVLRLVLFGEVSPEIPATYVQEHPDCLITVDSATSASPLVDA
jgi:6-phosphogluconolactonase/glucosamine-6-phosphate isomerase/deaminase